jgi:hypothetical protein
MRHLPLVLSLIAVSALSIGCSGSGGGGNSSDDDDDAGTAFPNPGPVDVPVSTGPQATLPDLTVDQDMLNTSWVVQEVNMDLPGPQAEYACAVQEGCIGASGVRKLLKFDVGVVNLGTANVHIGDPSDHPDADMDGIPDDFEYAPCHDHLHFKDFAKYEVSDGLGNVLLGAKGAFCLIDLYKYDNNAGPSNGYGDAPYYCGFQGITMGWGDIYDSGLDCQWIDVTDLDPGNYDLTVHINSEHRIQEAGPEPNTATVQVNIE